MKSCLQFATVIEEFAISSPSVGRMPRQLTGPNTNYLVGD